MSAQHGSVYWTELMTRDVPAALAYYTDVLGWEISEMPDPSTGAMYYIGSIGGAPQTGIMDMAALPGTDDMPPHWFTYFAVDDVDQSVAATAAAGGAVIRPAFDVEGIGRIAILTDPTGAAMGLMTPAEQSKDG